MLLRNAGNYSVAKFYLGTLQIGLRATDIDNKPSVLLTE